jgi:hypothetical protein
MPSPDCDGRTVDREGSAIAATWASVRSRGTKRSEQPGTAIAGRTVREQPVRLRVAPRSSGA